MSSKDQMIVDFIDRQFNEYTGSTLYQNWRLLCDNILDASEQHYRPGEQLTRQGLYYGVMRAQRDGWREAAVDSFGQARPLFIYKPRRDVPAKLADRAQEVITDIWNDIKGLNTWLALWNDAVDYSMAIAYTKYCHYGEVREKPTVKKQLWGEQLEWEDSFDIVADSPDFIRIHPYNYRCSLRAGMTPEWEGCEWEWTMTDLQDMVGDSSWEQGAIKRLIEKMAKGEIGKQSRNYYDMVQDKSSKANNLGGIYAKEYWGTLQGVSGMERDKRQWVVVICEGEVIRKQENRLRLGRNVWRPLKRIRLDPMNDIPYGAHVMAATLSHQRQKNLMLNLASDDIIIRQHLGFAAWRGALENPNQLLNPEGAKEPIWMRHDADASKLPRFFADQSSGVLRDAMQFDSQVTERDLQISGLPYQSLGLGGGAQGKTATEQTYLANNSSRKMRTAFINSVETGLGPICKDLLALLLRNNAPEDLQLSPQEQIQVFTNNFWTFDTSLTTNLPAQSAALANWGSMAMQQMAAIAPAGSPASADHLVRFLKDSGKALGIPASSLDSYLPDGMPPQVQSQPQPGQPPQGSQPAPQPEQASPEEMQPQDEEAMNAMA